MHSPSKNELAQSHAIVGKAWHLVVDVPLPTLESLWHAHCAVFTLAVEGAEVRAIEVGEPVASVGVSELKEHVALVQTRNIGDAQERVVSSERLTVPNLEHLRHEPCAMPIRRRHSSRADVARSMGSGAVRLS